jgi:NAD-dependent DNA ligase
MIAAIQSPRAAATGGVSTLKGKTVVFTGPLSMRRRKAEELVNRVGGKIGDSVRNGTDVLVRGSPSSHWLAGDQGKKLIDAVRLQERGARIRVINERQFKHLVKLR